MTISFRIKHKSYLNLITLWCSSSDWVKTSKNVDNEVQRLNPSKYDKNEWIQDFIFEYVTINQLCLWIF